MRTRRNRTLKRRRGRKMSRKLAGGKKSGKKWTTAIDAAQKTLSKTGSFSRASKIFKIQALANARKLFGALPQKQ